MIRERMTCAACTLVLVGVAAVAVGSTRTTVLPAGSEREPTGACCAFDTQCWDEITESACWAVYAGIWQGPGSTCDSTDCYGACCLTGFCISSGEAQCVYLYYADWLGSGTTCESDPCPEPTGACCAPGGECEQKTESACESAGGAFAGLTIPCDPSPCVPVYCTAGSSTCDEYIARVQVGAIDNASACTRYADYTALSTDVVLGEQYLVTVTNGRPYEADICSVWIDWDTDYIFEEVPPEWIGDVVGGGASPPYRLAFTVPGDCALGVKRMRVRIDYHNPDPSPCGITIYGEVEDYSLNVVAPPGACCLEYGRCAQLSEPECDAAGGTGWSLGLPCEPNPCPQPELLMLIADRDCYQPGYQVVIEVWMKNITEAIVGGQFFLAYDPSKLVFVRADPGDAAEADPLNPFERELYEASGAGSVDCAVGVREPGAYPPDPDGDDGTAASGSRRMAVLTFTALAEICDEPALVTWRGHMPPSRLSDSVGHPVVPELVAAALADHIAPAITCPPDIGIECDDPRDPDFTGWAISSDNCDPAPLVEWSDTEDLTGCDSTGTIARTWTATDHCGNRNSCHQIITVVDRVAPDLTCPPNLVLECGPDNAADIADWLASATAENCGPVDLTNNYTGLSDGCGGTGTATVFFTATDGCGLTSTCTRSITVHDTTPPVLDCPDDVILECGPGTPDDIATWLASASASDACGSASITNNYAGLSDDCAATGTALVTFMARDECGLTASCQRRLTVADTRPPTFTRPVDVTHNADPGSCALTLSLAEIGWPMGLHDDCSAPGALRVAWLRSDGVAPPLPLDTPFTLASTTITWTVTDECDNTSPPQVQTIAILPYNAALIDIELQGDLAPDTLVRCVHFVFADTPTHFSVQRQENVEFIRQPDGNGLATLDITDLPCHAYDCVTAKDPLHTLTVRLAPGLTSDGDAFAVAFTGPGSRLLQGDLVQIVGGPADYVDIYDFSAFISEWGRVYDSSLPPGLPDGDGNTPCGSFTLHADLNGDGVVDISDYAFITANYRLSGDPHCMAEPGPIGTESQDVTEPGRGGPELQKLAEPGRVGPEFKSSAQKPEPGHLGPESNEGAPAVRFTAPSAHSVPTPAQPQPLCAPCWSVTVAELDALGLSRFAVADLNHDGVVDAADIAAFEQGARPAGVPERY